MSALRLDLDAMVEQYWDQIEDHIRSWFQPESAEMMLADEYTVQEFAKTFRRDELRAAKLARAGRPEPAWVTSAPADGFYLYRLWTEDGRLLYVGVSTCLAARLRTHKSRWRELFHRATWEEYRDAPSMLAAERAAIRDEDPALNRAGVG